MRLVVPDLAAARALARRWSGAPGRPVTVWETVLPEEAEAALRAGRADLAFVPTLAVLRDPEAFSVVPGVALVGRAYRPALLHVPAGLDALRPGGELRVGVDPRFAQEALLARVVLQEQYGVNASFAPFDGTAPDDLPALLLPPDSPVPERGLTLDLGQEWFELTTRPMVWALLAAVAGGVEPAEASFLRDTAAEQEGETPTTPDAASVTLGAYAHAGLEAWVHYLYYYRALSDLPAIPFVPIPEDDAATTDAETP